MLNIFLKFGLVIFALGYFIFPAIDLSLSEVAIIAQLLAIFAYAGFIVLDVSGDLDGII